MNTLFALVSIISLAATSSKLQLEFNGATTEVELRATDLKPLQSTWITAETLLEILLREASPTTNADEYQHLYHKGVPQHPQQMLKVNHDDKNFKMDGNFRIVRQKRRRTKSRPQKPYHQLSFTFQGEERKTYFRKGAKFKATGTYGSIRITANEMLEEIKEIKELMGDEMSLEDYELVKMDGKTPYAAEKIFIGVPLDCPSTKFEIMREDFDVRKKNKAENDE